ncbi:hypothetical protein EIP91_001735 [Steccherinum ochraceum]|uniref:Peptidase metallopeptidase domain-containing protein n=1 Tax=Steccherinum ochraceum TaxID=92696 RepID=A0A4R0RFU3_9APHY|nr:hypothetical protein EIP91_001735 [Steccherinum ochraceum]
MSSIPPTPTAVPIAVTPTTPPSTTEATATSVLAVDNVGTSIPSPSLDIQQAPPTNGMANVADPAAAPVPAATPVPVLVAQTPSSPTNGLAPPPKAMASLASSNAPIITTVPTVSPPSNGTTEPMATPPTTTIQSPGSSGAIAALVNGGVPAQVAPPLAVPTESAVLAPVTPAPTDTAVVVPVNPVVQAPVPPAIAPATLNSRAVVTPTVSSPVPPSPSAKLGLRKALVTGSQPWFSLTCADLAPPGVQVAANATSDPSALSAIAVARAALLWDNGSVSNMFSPKANGLVTLDQTITYGYIPGSSTAGQQAKIDAVMTNFLPTNVNLTLTKVDMTANPATPPTIRIACAAGYGSWSYVGQACAQVASPNPTMNSDAISDSSVLTTAENGIILHQWLHALGMTHELPSTVRLNATAAYSFYSFSQGWTSDQVAANILNVYNTEDVSNYAEVDRQSLMMYYMPPQLTVSGQNVPINPGPSVNDVAWLNVNYPSTTATSNLSTYLDTLRVTGSTKTAMLTSPLATLRTQLATWQATQLIQSATSEFNISRPARGVQGGGGGNVGRALAEIGPLDPPPVPQPDIKAQTGNFLDAIVKSFRQVFNPGGGQIFTLQFPGRFLQMSLYAWDTNSAGIYGQLVKPVAVNENEFRLVDQLYDVADVVSAPNGVSLSQVYEQLLNNLVPLTNSNGLAELQDEIRKWLLSDVKASSWVQRLVETQHSVGDVPDNAASKISDTGTINRIELSNALMQDYLTSKQAWETERDQMMEDAIKAANSADALNTLSRRLAHTTATRKAQLAAKYTDAIVRGYTHNVREYVSYLDVKTTAEALQDAKDALREAAASSMDGSLKVYPVQLSPIDWFEGLSTAFTPEDLTTNADALVQQINTKSQQLDVLNSQLVALQLGQKGDVDDLEKRVETAQGSVDTQLTNLQMTYTNNVISMAKTCIDKQGELDTDQLAAVATGINLDPAMFDQLAEDMGAVATAQQALTAASRAYARALADFALAQATDTKQQQEQIRQQITSLTKEIDNLTSRYQSLNKVGERPTAPPATPTTTVEDEALLPPTNNDAGGSRWQEIVMHNIVQSDYSKQSDRASGSTTSMTCNLWALSGSGELTTSSAEASQVTSKMRNEVWVGFRATLVTVDRAGWFQPQFFKQSAGYYHVARNMFWSRWPTGVASVADLKKAGDPAFQVVNQGLLPAYPQAIIICKDITIKISNDNTSTATSSVNMQSMAAASGGVLCFSFSSSDSDSSSDNTYSFKQCSDGCVIRIPGPQILGYIMQFTENDATRDLPANLANLFVPPADIREEIPAPRPPLQGLAPPARAVAVPVLERGQMVRQIDDILATTDLPSRTVVDIRRAVQEELDRMSDEIGNRIREG